MTRCGEVRRRVSTFGMSRAELAQTAAAQQGWMQDGGWVKDGGVVLAQGYEDLGVKLERLGLIRVGAGVDWRILSGASAERIRRA